MAKQEYKSRVYTDRPAYADFDAPAKFQAIQGIIATRLKQHPKAICSYSGGADSDILIDIIERTRAAFPSLPPVKYAFFNTGLEMKATKDHVKATAEKYGVEIKEYRPKVGIVQATRKYGVPFVSKIMSAGLSEWQKKGVPLSIAQEYEQAEDKPAKRAERERRILGFRYKEGLTYEEIGKRECVTRERIRQINAKALRKLRHPDRLNYLKYGVSGVIARKTESARKAALASLPKPDIPESDIPLEELDLSVRSYSCLKRAGINTLREIAEMTFDELCHVRNLGKKSLDEICAVLTGYGIRLRKGGEQHDRR